MTNLTLEKDLKQKSYDALMIVLDAADAHCDWMEEDSEVWESHAIREAISLLRNAAVNPSEEQ